MKKNNWIRERKIDKAKMNWEALADNKQEAKMVVLEPLLQPETLQTLLPGQNRYCYVLEI